MRSDTPTADCSINSGRDDTRININATRSRVKSEEESGGEGGKTRLEKYPYLMRGHLETSRETEYGFGEGNI